MTLPTLRDVQKAHERITSHIHRTPVLSNRQVNERAGASIFFKCENFQKVGAFKFRGATNAILSLPDEQLANGVATHSSGNHAQAVALAARQAGVAAFIVMPENAPEVKIRAVEGYGADITFCESTQQAREQALADVVEQTSARFIPPYDDPKIISGQGTAALELLEDHPGLDLILAPVGGGGLLSGTAVAAKNMTSKVQVIGCEPEMADDAYRSFTSGTLQPVDHPDTVADGLRTSLSELTFSCIQQHVDGIVTVREQQIIEAMRFVWERMKIIIEASSAVPVAAIFDDKIEVQNKKVGLIISGGNVELDQLPWMT